MGIFVLFFTWAFRLFDVFSTVIRQDENFAFSSFEKEKNEDKFISNAFYVFLYENLLFHHHFFRCFFVLLLNQNFHVKISECIHFKCTITLHSWVFTISTKIYFDKQKRDFFRVFKRKRKFVKNITINCIKGKEAGTSFMSTIYQNDDSQHNKKRRMMKIKL